MSSEPGERFSHIQFNSTLSIAYLFSLFELDEPSGNNCELECSGI